MVEMSRDNGAKVLKRLAERGKISGAGGQRREQEVGIKAGLRQEPEPKGLAGHGREVSFILAAVGGTGGF